MEKSSSSSPPPPSSSSSEWVSLTLSLSLSLSLTHTYTHIQTYTYRHAHTHTSRPSWTSLCVSLLNNTQYTQKADEVNFLPHSKYWCAHEWQSIGEGHLLIRPYFSSDQLVLHILLEGFVKREVSGRTAAVLRDATLCSHRLTFSRNVSLEVKWWFHIVVRTRLLLGLFPISDFHIFDNLSTATRRDTQGLSIL